MALMYYPRQGEILLCNFDTGFVPPEMVKRRPVVVVSPRLRKRFELVAIVPLSTTDPDPVQAHHCMLELERPLPAPFNSPVMWAKSDMLVTVARSRLDRFRAGRRGGPRKYVSGQINPEQFRAVRASILCGLGLENLTNHLD